MLPDGCVGSHWSSGPAAQGTALPAFSTYIVFRKQNNEHQNLSAPETDVDISILLLNFFTPTHGPLRCLEGKVHECHEKGDLMGLQTSAGNSRSGSGA